MPKVIHVIQGDSAAGCFIQAMRPSLGELLVSQDVLSCGPLPPFRSFEQWTRMRLEFWDSVAADDHVPGLYHGEHLAIEATFRGVDSLIVWLGSGLAEQLLLAWLVQVLKLSQSRAKLSVVQFGAEVWGVGLLNPKQIEMHPPIEELSGETLAELERYWAAVTSPDPAELLGVLDGAEVFLRPFHSALQTHILRYPNPFTGLGRWDRELLKNTGEYGPRTALVIGHTMGLNFDSDLVGDAYLYARLLRLADRAHPLVSISGDPASMRTCEVALTATGQDVLAGRANAMALNGIDEWVLGVHLSSERDMVWYYEDGTLVPG